MEGSTQNAPTQVRIAGGPISWGVCEVPGWGVQLPPDRVLEEMRSAGLTAIEAGPDGYLGSDPEAIRRLLERHGLRLVGGFVPVVLHDRNAWEATFADVVRIATLHAAAGAEVLLSAVVTDRAWSSRIPLDDDSWRTIVEGLARLDDLTARHGLRHALHPHIGTLVETADDLDRVLVAGDVRLCLDTGHLVLGGIDPVALARDAGDRVAHVHLKDVEAGLAEELRRGDLTLMEATRRGVFRALGEGDAPIAATVDELRKSGYDGWYVLEQDMMLEPSGPPESAGTPIDDTRRSIRFLHRLGLVGDPAPIVQVREVSGTR